MKVIKRNGKLVNYNGENIINAVSKSMNEVLGYIKKFDVAYIEQEVRRKIKNKDNVSVEEIQDLVEIELMKNYPSVAKSYILYRDKREKLREHDSIFMNLYENIVDLSDKNMMQENANVDGNSPMGQMGKIGFESAKVFAKRRMLTDTVKKAIDDNLIHIHDLDFMPTGTTTCSQIPLSKLLAKGFNTGHGHMRTPQSIESAAALTAIIFQANQNNQHGGQSMSAFDYDLAPYVTKSYLKNLDELYKIPLGVDISEKEINKLAWDKTVRDTEQAMEAFIHNMNSMNSRSAGQVPFTSVNYGTDTSKEGRLIVNSILKATEEGLGNGETPIFPIQIFKVKEGINYNTEDPNYDLLVKATEVTSKRLFPNFSFLDAPYNLEKYVEGDINTEVSYMGCRTRVLANVNGEEIVTGRGNLSFTTVNLVKIALMCEGNMGKFYGLLKDNIEIIKDQLLDRYKFQCKKQVKNFKFLMGEGVWIDSDKLKSNDTLEDVLKHGTLSIGFIGLAETLKALTGKHHGESEESQKLGLDIINYMKNIIDKYSLDYKLNFTLLATPSEGTAGKYVISDRMEFGNIEGVTDREYYTNSFHIPVYHEIGVYDKIKLEAPYHELTNAGHITYVELDGNARQNPEAIMQILQTMKVKGIGYGSINHPIDRCPLCGFGGIIGIECPECHAKEQDGVKFERIRRITGYLVGDMDKWNDAKKSEEKDRVKHGVKYD